MNYLRLNKAIEPREKIGKLNKRERNEQVGGDFHLFVIPLLAILEVYDNEFRAALRGITRHKRGEIILGNRAIDY